MEMIMILICTVILLCYLYATRNFNYWRDRGIPFEKPVPFLGSPSLVLFRKCLGTYLKDLYEKSSGPLYGFFIFDKPQLIARDPDIIKRMLVKDFQQFHDRTMVMNNKDDPVGSNMLFVIHNPNWKIVRRKITAAFTSGKLKLMFPLMAEPGGEITKYVEKMKGQCSDTKLLCLKFSTDVITSCAFGVKGSCFEEENSEFFVAAQKIFNFTWSRGIQMTCYFISPLLVKLFKMKFLHPYSCTFLRNIFWEVLIRKKQTNIKRNDLIDALLEMDMTDHGLRLALDGDLAVAQAAQFFVAGYETSGSTACMTLYELALNVDIQNRLRKEILEVRKKHNGITYDAVKDMKYLEMVMYESMRKYPILPFLDRRAQINYNIPGTNVTIEKGTPVFIPSLGIHYDPQYYPDPHKFDPERFTLENRNARDNSLFLAFGEGPRNCIGARFGSLTSKLAVIYLLSEFEVIKTEKTPAVIDYDPRGFLLAPSHPIPLQFKKISS